MQLKPSNSVKKLSLAEKLDILPALISVSLAAFYAALTGLSRGPHQAKTFFLHVGYAILRKATARLSGLQLQYISPPSNKIYEQYTRRKKLIPQTVDLGHGALGHWIGNRNAKNVLVWYHGGGFSLPANIGYFKFYTRLLASLNASNKDMAIFALTYTLAPQATYPTQLTQAVECLRYVLTVRAPSAVFLGGDSAGGNLVMGVLSHLSHAHAKIQPLEITQPLGGAVMIAPWTLLDSEFPGREIVHAGDIITQAVAAPWAAAYLGGSCSKDGRDFYTDASMAPSTWFEGLKVRRVLVTAGENEILLPLIRDFVDKLTAGFPDVELFVGTRECHVAPIYNLYLGDNQETEQGKKVAEWLREML